MGRFQKTDHHLTMKTNSQTEDVCVFPLPNVVLLPGVVLPLHIFEDRYKQMTDEAITTSTPVALSLSRALPNGEKQNSTICGAGKINIIQYYPDGRKDVCVEGVKRLKIVEYIQKEPYLKAKAFQLTDIPFANQTLENQYKRELSLLAKRWVFLNPDLQDHLMDYVNIFKTPHHLADFIAFYFLPSPKEKQNLLEMLDCTRRVEKMMGFLEGQIRKFEQQDHTNINHGAPVKILH